VGNMKFLEHELTFMQKITAFEAHPDYIRAIAVHPTLPYILTASDDMTIKVSPSLHREKMESIHVNFIIAVGF
jgi:hypothetical protein